MAGFTKKNDDMRENSGFAATTPQLFGVFGDPVGHSLSPAMHNRAFALTGYNGVYLPFRIREIAPAIAAMQTLDIKGVSITLPHKISAMAYMDSLDPLAEQIGAINTIVNSDSGLTGYNSDCIGALGALSRQVDINGKAIAIIGAGGAARAIGHGIVEAGGKVTIVNRSRKSGQSLAADLSSTFLPLSSAGRIGCDILINTTPVGMHPQTDAMPVSANVLHREMLVMDIVYTPLKTMLLKKAEQAGCATIDGLAMFVRQGAYQFELWTGLEAPVSDMRDTVRKILEERQESCWPTGM